MVALSHRKLGNALVGQFVAIIADMYFFCIHLKITYNDAMITATSTVRQSIAIGT